MGKKVLAFLADGFEEVEAVTPIDYLRRAGIEVTVAATGKEKTVTGSHTIKIEADTTIAALKQAGHFNAASWDGTFVPGGMPGSSNLAACAEAGSFFKEMTAAGKITAAICAAPAVFLAPLGLLDGKKFTCYQEGNLRPSGSAEDPGKEKEVGGGVWAADKVVVDGNLVTSRGAGTAAVFALAIIELLAGKDAAKSVGEAVLL
jgi:4-methyl-5(b-hydroxyethyl)-thiazole monophosphate biosynthesis